MDSASIEALGRVDDRAKEGIKNLDRRITLMEDRLEDNARLQAQDARELREKIDLQTRRFETFTEQQSVLILTANNNKKCIQDIEGKLQDLATGMPAISQAVIKITELLDENNIPEIRNNVEKVECRVDDLEDKISENINGLSKKIDHITWWIIGGMGAIITTLIGYAFIKG